MMPLSCLSKDYDNINPFKLKHNTRWYYYGTFHAVQPVNIANFFDLDVHMQKQQALM